VTSVILDRLRSALANRYELKRELARGGMGQVFEARDLKHGRSVAIKVLDPELAASIGPARFRAEIETAARLSHPHIVPLFDSGEADGLFYFVMPLIAGESLRQRLSRERQLPVEDALRIAREAADALEYAHGQGLVHRDVKPENILLAGGHALVLDFGIARSRDGGEGGSTRTVTPIGTPAYMSPEQIAGADLDGRCDQYALACVVYEMLAGQPPFTGPTPDIVLSQHRSAAPRSVDTMRPAAPTPVGAALSRALAKAPADRYRTLSDFAAALTTVPTPTGLGRGSARLGGAGRVMLAVLPLENLSADPEQEYFVDGMTDELISHLSRLQPKRLGVIARTSALRYKKTGKSIEEIGRELGVEFVLEGSVRRAGDRIRITTQLIQVSDQSNLWAQTHDRRLADIFELQDEVATTIAKALEMELVPSREASDSSAEVTKSAAYEAYLKGRFHWNKRTPEGIRLGIEWFERAVQADPQFARAYSGLSDVYNIAITYMLLPAEEALPKSERAARRALELDPDLVDAHASLGSVLTHKGEPEEARHVFRRALELDPNYVPALYWGAMNFVTLGDFEGATGTVARADALDPLSVTVKIVQGNIHFYARRYDQALSYFRHIVELEPKLYWPHQRVAICMAAQGRLEEALAELDRHPADLTGSLDLISARAYMLGRLGRLDEARAALEQLEVRSKSEYVSWERFAYAYLGLDDRTSLLKVLERVKVPGVLGRLSLRHESAFDPVRDDPRFEKLLRV